MATSKGTPTATQAARLETEAEELRVDLERTRYELQLLHSRRATRFGETLRRGGKKKALVGLVKASTELVRPAKKPSKPELPNNLLAPWLRKIRQLRDEGNLVDALLEAQNLNQQSPDEPEVLDLLIGLNASSGHLKDALGYCIELAHFDQSARFSARRARLAGQLRALHPQFLPVLGSAHISSRQGNPVVLIPESATELAPFLEAFIAGLECDVFEVLDGLPPHYPGGGVRDIVLTDSANGINRKIAELNPNVIVSVITQSSCEAASLGRALAASTQVNHVVLKIQTTKQAPVTDVDRLIATSNVQHLNSANWGLEADLESAQECIQLVESAINGRAN
ncbi:MAG: hypothetical protein WCL12_03580 [Actinomycetes bacterium]